MGAHDPLNTGRVREQGDRRAHEWSRLVAMNWVITPEPPYAPLFDTLR